MVSRWMLRLFGLTLAVICLCAGLLPSQRINAESVCYIEGCPDGQPPVITDQPDDVTIPYKGTATFSVTATGTGTLSYQWYQMSIYGDEEDLWYGQTSTFVSSQLRVSTRFRVRVLNEYGYTDSDLVVAYIDHVTDSSSFCTSQQLSIGLVHIPQSDGRYVAWTEPSGELFLHDSSTNTTALIANNSSGRLSIDNGRMLWSTVDDTTYLMDLHTNEIHEIYIYVQTLWLTGQYIVWSTSSGIAVYNLNTETTSNVFIRESQNNWIMDVNARYVVGNGYAYDLLLGISTIFSAEGYYTEYTLADTYVLWSDFNSTDVHLFDLTSQQQRNLSNTPNLYERSFDLEGTKVVWESSDSTGIYTRVYLYDLLTGMKTELSTGDDRNHYYPQIKNNRIVWLTTPSAGDIENLQLRILDLTTQYETIIPMQESYYSINIQMNDQWVVWNAEDGIYLYDGVMTHQIMASTTLSIDQLTLADNLLWWRGAPRDRGYIEYEYYWHPFTADCRGNAPTITDQPDNMLISTGESITLSVTAIGDGSLGYQWYQGTSGDTSNPVPGATASSYTTPPLTTLTNYWVRVNGTFGTVDSDTASIVNRDEWTPTWTPVPPTATETPMPTASWTPQPDTETPMPTATWTDVPPTQATMVPTATTAPVVSLLINGGFDVDSDGDKLPDGWTAKKTNADKADKLRCDKDDKVIAHSAPCTFVFSGNPDGSTSTLSQPIDPAALYDGSTLTLSAWIDPKSAPSGLKFAQVKVVYSDGSSTKMKLSLPDGNGYVQQNDTATLDLTGKTVKSAKINLKYDQPGGKFYVDDVTLTTSPSTALFALP